MIYKKATAEVVLFDNTDILMQMSGGGECRVPGWDNGNKCTGNRSEDCPNQAWK